MAPRTRRTAAAAKEAIKKTSAAAAPAPAPAKPQQAIEERAIEEPALSDSDDEETVTIVTKPPPSFKPFKTSVDLKDGLCIIRKLEDGRYELVSLSSESHEDVAFGSMEFGNMIRNEQSGERLELLESVMDNWKGAEFRVGQALGSAKLRVFRFLELPIELRYRVYEMTVCSTKTICRGSYNNPIDIIGGIHLRGTCHQVKEETDKFFWRNNFRIPDLHSPLLKHILPLITENLREMTWTWIGYKIKDTAYLRMLKSLVNLKILNIRITQSSINHSRHYWKPPVHRDEPAVAKFKNTHGFNELFELRGLENVTVRVRGNGEIKEGGEISPSRLSIEELQAFEAFLKSQVTKPKDPPKVLSKSKADKKVKAGKKRKSFAWFSGDDDDDNDDDYMPAKSRRRRG